MKIPEGEKEGLKYYDMAEKHARESGSFARVNIILHLYIRSIYNYLWISNIHI